MPGDHDRDAPEPAPVSPDDWRDTERWLEEWRSHVAEDNALAGRGTTPSPAPLSSASATTSGARLAPPPGPHDLPPDPAPDRGLVPAPIDDDQIDDPIDDPIGDFGDDPIDDFGDDPLDEPDDDPIDDFDDDPIHHQVPALPPGYKPPSSPAYAAGGLPAPSQIPRPARQRPARPAPAPVPPYDSDLRSTPLSRGRLRARRLLAAGLAVMAVALAVAVIVSLRDDEPEALSLGEVRTADAGATIRDGGRTSPLEVDSVVVVGAVVRAPADGAVAVAFDGGGSVRFDSGASVTFIDEAIDAETGERDGDSRPVLEVLSGRVWVNPPDGTVVDVVVPGGRVTSDANPVAIECPSGCNVQAPAGGVDIDATTGADAAPSPSEIVGLEPDGSMALQLASPATAWAQQNLAADAQDDLADPEPADTPGVVASSVIDGAYPLGIDVVGQPEGDALPENLRYGTGERYSLDLQTDGSACPPASCQAPLTASGGGSGTADVGDGTLTINFTQSIDCFDETRSYVVADDIGTTTVSATLTVSGVAQDGTRWRIATASGTGTVATTLTTPCNPGDVLGTSTSATSVTLG